MSMIFMFSSSAGEYYSTQSAVQSTTCWGTWQLSNPQKKYSTNVISQPQLSNKINCS